MPSTTFPTLSMNEMQKKLISFKMYLQLYRTMCSSRVYVLEFTFKKGDYTSVMNTLKSSPICHEFVNVCLSEQSRSNLIKAYKGPTTETFVENNPLPDPYTPQKQLAS